MTETEKTTGAYDPYAIDQETEASRSEKMKKEAQEKYEELKETAFEKKERLSRKWSDTAAETRRAARQVGHKAKDAGTSVYDAISENLFPTILTGIGAAWLTASILRSRSESDMKIESSFQAQGTKARIGDKAMEVGDKAKEIKERAIERSRRTREKSREMMTKNTFYVAGALAGMGLLIGLAFPETEGEQRIADELREEFREKKSPPAAEGAQSPGEPEMF
ncbi:MAG: hypothetical protein C4530_00600 [Desulfobacteraceae bacterium]|nr:MAG: hypothetical protein C4530_00600 [Desulfobacteraceae bacterium]